MDRYRQIHFGFRIPMITLPIGCLFQLISVGSPYWVKIKVSSLIQSVDIHLGLWRACFALNNAKPECSSDMSDNPGNERIKILKEICMIRHMSAFHA